MKGTAHISTKIYSKVLNEESVTPKIGLSSTTLQFLGWYQSCPNLQVKGAVKTIAGAAHWHDLVLWDIGIRNMSAKGWCLFTSLYRAWSWPWLAWMLEPVLFPCSTGTGFIRSSTHIGPAFCSKAHSALLCSLWCSSFCIIRWKTKHVQVGKDTTIIRPEDYWNQGLQAGWKKNGRNSSGGWQLLCGPFSFPPAAYF